MNKSDLRFVVQKHAARTLHYDFRLEMEGVLKSWAVPKGPCLDPSVKRLAVEVEDHTVEFGDFEGVIAQGQYGAGAIIVWDRGTWHPKGDSLAGYRTGRLTFELLGEKLRGVWNLARMRDQAGRHGHQWLLTKEQDIEGRELSEYDVLVHQPASVISGRTVAEVSEADA